MAEKDELATELVQGQAEAWKHVFSFVDSMALKCAVELGISDILHSENRPLSLPEIASKISDTSSPNIPYLSRIMRLLVHKKIFTSVPSPDSGSLLFGPSPASRWLLRGSDTLSLAPFLLMQTNQTMLSPWHQFSSCVRGGGDAFEKAHGYQVFDLAARNPEINNLFNEAMECTGKITMNAIVSGFNKDAWDGLESVVDVGGGTGHVIAEIVDTYKHIKGINFDLPHVIQAAPEHAGVKNVAGDMFDAVPQAHAVFMKWIMHDWNDEDCVKILRNCKKAIPEETGKIFIVDAVLSPDGDAVFGSCGLQFDLVMMAHASGGMERTEPEWQNLLRNGGFPRYNITKIPAPFSIIEAYPN